MAVIDSYIRWPRTRKLVLSVVVGVAIVGAYYGLIYRNKLAEVTSLENQSANLETELRKKRAVAAKLETVKQAVALLDEELTKSLKQLPTSEEIPALLKTVSNLGLESGLEFLLFRPGANKPVGPAYFYAEVPVEMENVGTFHDVATFFDKVSRLDRIVTVEQIAITNLKYMETGSPKLRAKYTATTFRFIPEAERPKAPPPGKGKK